MMCLVTVCSNHSVKVKDLPDNQSLLHVTVKLLFLSPDL